MGSDETRVQFGRDRFIDLRETSPAFIAGRLLLGTTRGDEFVIDTPLQQLVVATFMRSQDTYTGILSLLLDDLPTQAAMLARSLFEDLVVGHWLVFNADDVDWLIQRFHDHHDAMGLYQRRLDQQTGWRIGEPILDSPDAVEPKAKALRDEYGPEATGNWWDPGRQGRGEGRAIGLRGVAGKLEDAARRHERFNPRFAGGEQPLLRRMERVALKWFNQCLHHTAIGLPIKIVEGGELPGVIGDPTGIVAFTSWWMFAQQHYLLHDLYGRAPERLNEVVKFGLESAFTTELRSS